MSVEDKCAPVLTLRRYLSGEGLLPTGQDGFHAPSRILVIPPWQREYVWTPSDDGEVGVLLRDLREFVLDGENDYLMGSVLLSHGGKPNERLLIDGQQRTLTYTILLMAVLKHVQNQHEFIHHLGSPTENAIEDSTLVDMRACVSGDISMYKRRVSMPHGKANEMLQAIFHWSKMPDGEESEAFTAEKDHWTQTQRNLINVATWIYEKQLKTEAWLPNKDLLRHMRKILDEVKFLQVTLSTQQEAISIFDRINSRGALLDSGDLIKNRIFQAVTDDEAFDEISRSWISMNESLAKCSLKRMREPKFLLRSLALADQAIHMEATSQGDEEPDTKLKAPKLTYERLTTYWGDKLSANLARGESSKKINPIKFSEDLVTASQWLQAFSSESTMKNQPLKDLYFARYLNSVQHFPVLLAGRFISDHKVLVHLAKQVHARTAFYLLSDERTQDFESLIPTWTGLVAKLGPKASVAQLSEIYAKHVQVSDSSMDALIEQMRHWSYASSDRKKLRAALSQLTRIVDMAGGKEDKESPISYFSTRKDQNSESWDIDHIRPKSVAPSDPETHHIGNLVLLKADHNSLKKASAPRQKEDVYRGSHLLLTQSLVKITVDNERTKAQKLFKAAGVTDTSWSLDNWDERSMQLRADLYCALMRHHLTEQ